MGMTQDALLIDELVKFTQFWHVPSSLYWEQFAMIFTQVWLESDKVLDPEKPKQTPLLY